MRTLLLVASAIAFTLGLGGCEIRPFTIQFGDGSVPQVDGGSGDVLSSQDAGRDALHDAGPDGPLCVPREETCNGQDDDCDGITDNVAPSKLQSDPNNCGACGRACVLPNATGDCINGDCVFTKCNSNAGDVNGDLGLGLNGSDGCECLKSNGGVEICDGKDNDCDGITDNAPPGQELPGVGVMCAPAGGCDLTTGICKGECSIGVQKCHPDGYLYCDGAKGPEPEVCDGLDNNCDGQTDEGVDVQLCYPYATGCDISTGECKGVCKIGVRLCQGAAGYGDCQGDVGPSQEICDGLDNNCDGQTDEGTLPGVGSACFPSAGCPNGQCLGECRPGTQVCNAGRLECLNPIGPQPEVCDGKDNDCNGITDDGLPPKACYTKGGNGCTFANGNWTCKGICRLGWIICHGADGWSPSCEGDVGPSVEVCNGVDDDCDGQIDNGAMAGVGVACYPSQGCPGGVCKGACAPGTTVCQNGDIVCPDAKGPSVEVCNGIDDNCDGQTDENIPDRSCYTPTFPGDDACDPTTGLCRGACRMGHTTCQNGGWSSCLGQTGPAPEQCDGIDNDCDGVTDNPPSGQQLPGVGVACYPAQGCPGGSCKGECAPGTSVCTAGHITCPDAKGPTPEICDGKDNDCDGTTDNGMTPQLCYPNGTPGCDPSTGACKGICRFGRQTCLGTAGWSGCVNPAPVTPGQEVCDGLDNDCDGFTDNGTMPGVAVPCYPSQGCPSGVCKGECAAGTTVCQTGQIVCPDAKGPSPEVCDNKDNDCDGVTDGIQEACYSGGSECSLTTGQCNGECRVGLKTCTAGSWSATCAGEVKPTTEVCNAKDDNCDGFTDNRDPAGDPLTQACYTGPAGTQGVGQCQGGNQTCQAATGTWGACTGQVVPAVETCNHVDDDCDGTTDNIAPSSCYPGGTPGCSGGTCVGECRYGQAYCDAGGNLQCGGTLKTPTAEICDGLDNNCDGLTDTADPAFNDARVGVACYPSSGCPGTPPVCQGICHPGTTACTGGAVVCQNAQGPMPELCNGIDDNCDGQTDEGFDLQNDPHNCGSCNNDCTTKPAATNAVATCVTGTCHFTCQAGYWDLDGNPANGCEYACTPTGVEVCDGIDNDCDGKIDLLDTDPAPNGLHVPTNFCLSAGACAGSAPVCRAFSPLELGDENDQLSAWDIDGATINNTGAGALWATLSDNAGTRTVSLYRSAALGGADLVAQGTHVGDGILVLGQMNGSGLSGSVAVKYVAADSTVSINVPLPADVNDQLNQLAGWAIYGASTLNTNAGLLYVNLTNSGGTITVQLYRSSARGAADLVAQGSRSGNGVVIFAAANGSGLTGNVTVTYSADDVDVIVPVMLPREDGDESNQLSGWVIKGATETNTNAGFLYAALVDSAGTRTVSLYSSPPPLAAANLVAEGSRSGDGVVTLTSALSSGLSGSVTVAWTSNDSTVTLAVPIYTWVCSYDPQKVEVTGLNQVAFTESRCDNLDNNCDGYTDEPFFLAHGKGTHCEQDGTSGLPLIYGTCRGYGRWSCGGCTDISDPASCTGLGDSAVCDMACGAPTCKPQTAPGVEVCDGVDDNCNGILDDGALDYTVNVGTPYPGTGYRIDMYEGARPDARAGTAGIMEHRSCSMPGVIPWGSVTQTDAAAACYNAGKRLCTETEWQLACGGPTNLLYPYGASYLPNACNGYDADGDCSTPSINDDVIHPTGMPNGCPTPAQTACVNATYGTVDMSGNLREWTTSPVSGGTAYRIRGGSYDDISTALSCQFNFWALPPSYALPNIGFRCCSRCAAGFNHCPGATVCTADAQCSGGFCDSPVDGSGNRHCAYCINVWDSDNNNCGACGHVCTGGTTCQAGICK